MLLVPAASLSVVAVAAVPASAADKPEHKMPQAQAFDGNKPLSSVKEVTDLCSKGQGCRFVVDAVQEYRGGVISVGSGFLNCTSDAIEVDRTITLMPRVTDNVQGAITGRTTTTGRVSKSSQISLSGQADGIQNLVKNTKTWNNEMMKASANDTNESQTQGTLTGMISGQSTGTQESDQQYDSSAGRNDSRSWDNSVVSNNTVTAYVAAGDVLMWGYQDMGHRVKGTLEAVGTSKYVKNVVVDEPSIIESSSFVAQSYTAPKGACVDNRPVGEAVPRALASSLRATKPKTQIAVRSRKSD